MKKLLSLLLIGSLLACNSGETDSDDNKLDDNFTITGDIANGESLNFYLEALSQKGTINVANIQADESGHFELKGNIPGMGLYQLRMGESKDKIIPLTLSPGDEIKIKSTFTDFEKTPDVSGTDWAKVMTRYMKVYSDFRIKQEELQKQQTNLDNDEMMKRYFDLKNKVDEFAIKEMKKDPGNAFNIVLSASALPNMGFEYWKEEYLYVIQDVSEAFLKNYPKSPLSVTLSNQAYQLELEYSKFKTNSSGTMDAPEIALTNPEGKEIRLSSLRGKYVLVDFWASWCGPCRQESPNVVRLFNKYKNQGFTVYSVSLDNNAAAWKAAIEKDGLIWPNHVSDLKGWETPLTQTYGFNSIPHTVLLNKEGKIIGVGLRGTSLEQKLKEIFKN